MGLNKYEEMFINGSFWEELINDGYEKGINQSVLKAFSDPLVRLGVIESIKAGKYEIEPPRIQYVPKDDGSMREVMINSDIDRLILAAIARIYSTNFSEDIHPHCVSYQQGLSVPKILHGLAMTDKPGFKADLTKYFDSVPIELINRTIDRYDTGCFRDLLKTFYNDHRIQKDGEYIPRYKSLAQGCAFSSFLANVVLRELDDVMSEHCSIYYRYSDDILIFDDEPDSALALLENQLSIYGLQLNPKKVIKIAPGTPYEFLGGKIENGTVDLAGKSIKAYKKKIKSYCRNKKTKDRNSQKQAINAITKYVYGCGDSSFSWMEYFGKLCTTDKTIRELEYWTREQIRFIYTGKHNTKTNANKTSNETLRDLGWISMKQMYDVLNANSNVYRVMRRVACAKWVVDTDDFLWVSLDEALSLVEDESPQFGKKSFKLRESDKRYRIRGGSIPELLGTLEDFYAQAKYTTTVSNPLVLVESPENLSFEQFLLADNKAYFSLCMVLLALQNSDWDLGDSYFWQSTKYPELVIHKDWID